MKKILSIMICAVMAVSFATSPLKVSANTGSTAQNQQLIQLLMQMITMLQAQLAQLDEQNGGGHNTDAETTTALSTYVSKKFGYSLEYPKGWNVVSAFGGNEVVISSNDFKESADGCESEGATEGCDNNYTVLSGSQLIFSVSKVSGTARDFVQLNYDTDDDNIAFKSHRWAVIDGKKSLITELERTKDNKKNGLQTVRAMIPVGSQLYTIIYNFAYYTEGNGEVWENVLASFDTKGGTEVTQDDESSEKNIEDADISVEFLSDSSTYYPDDKMAVYKIKLRVNAEDADAHIASDQFGFFKEEDGSTIGGRELFDVITSADIENGLYVVREGKSETFTLEGKYWPSKTGTYQMRMNEFKYFTNSEDELRTIPLTSDSFVTRYSYISVQ